jgi:hypothetical protein
MVGMDVSLAGCCEGETPINGDGGERSFSV